MPALGRKSPLVKMICARTKIKPVNVIDVLRILPECMAEAFIQANPAEREVIDMTCVSMCWNKGNKWGPHITIKPAKKFKEHFTKLRYEKNYPLAVELFDLMHPKTKERVLKKGMDGGYNNTFD